VESGREAGVEKLRGGGTSSAEGPRRPDRSTLAVESSDEARALLAARRQGEAEAEVLDLNLRLKESLTRERRLLETVEEMREALEFVGQTERELRAQVERYAAYHRAVERSMAWRIVQFLRGLVGRRW
jgi:hypothetical protein